MKMKKLAMLLLLLFLLLPHAHAKSDYIIIRCNVNPLYIVGESIQIQAFILVFRNGKPTDESATLKVTVTGIDVNYERQEQFQIKGGKLRNFFLAALNEEGHYKIRIYAEKGVIKSQTMSFEFGVTHAPVPYFIEFSPGGEKLYFRSLKFDENGSIDPNYPFTLYIYQMEHGKGETLINTFKNVTNITYTIPKRLRRGIISVEVVDCYGWRNSATMDFSSFSFSGEPIMYDYEWKERYPFKGRTWKQILVTVLVMAILLPLLIIIVRRYEYG